MSPLKRNASSRTTRLMARASPYHSSVTLVEAQDSEAAGSPSDPTEFLRDLEDTVPGPNEQVKSAVSGPSMPKNRTLKSPRKPKTIEQSLEKPHPAPKRWRETYDTIKEMRTHIVAPVDTMGCDQAQFKETEPRVSNPPRYRVFNLTLP